MIRRCPESRFLFARATQLKSRRTTGFTLLEVLIAVMIFAVVLAAASTVFYGALRLRKGAAESLEQSLPRQQALAVVQRDLANLVVPGGTLSGVCRTTSITNVIGGQSSPDFYTSTGLIDSTSPWAEIQRVAYVLMDSSGPGADGKDLVRTVTRNLLPATLEEEPARQEGRSSRLASRSGVVAMISAPGARRLPCSQGRSRSRSRCRRARPPGGSAD